MSFHKDLIGADLHGAKSNSGAGSPVGVVTPGVVGEHHFDTTGKNEWVAFGLGINDWQLVGGGASATLTASPPADVTKAAAAVGVATDAARADHKHDVTTAAGTANPPGTANVEGSSTSLARADHKHALAAFGTGAGTFCEGNDARLSDSVVSGHLRGARLAWLSNSQVTVGTAGQASEAADSTAVLNMSWSGTLTAAITSSGAGGLDTGSEASSTWYAVHIIGDTSGSNSPAAMLSLSATAPTLPSGYDVFRRVGWTRNDSGSNFYSFRQAGSGLDRWIDWDEGDNYALQGGSATTFTDVDCSFGAAPTARRLRLVVYLQGNATDEQYLYLRPNGYTTETDVFNSGIDTNLDYWTTMTNMMCDDNQVIEYMVDNGADDVWLSVQGYVDEL